MVALPLAPPPIPPFMPPDGPYPGIEMIEGLVTFLPASHEGTGALERVTMTSAAGPVGQPALAVMVVVTEPAGAEAAGALEAGMDAAAEALETAEDGAGLVEYWLGIVSGWLKRAVRKWW